MAKGKMVSKPSGWLLLAGFLFIFGHSVGNPLSSPLLAGQRISLHPWLSVLEDSAGAFSATSLIGHPEAFRPLDSLHKGDPTSYYWLRTTLRTGNTYDPGRALSFNYLTFVDVYLYDSSGRLITQRLTGAFRPAGEITEGDSRLFTMLPLDRNSTYTLLLRVHHTKHYAPVFDFEMQPKRQYFNSAHTKESIDAALAGAICVFFVYSLLSWIVTRFRSYGWLLLFIGGIGSFALSFSPSWIDWFAPDHPATGWLLNAQLLYLGVFGLYGLVVDFWRIREDFPRLYKWMRWVPLVLLARSLSALCIDYFTGDYRLSGYIDRMCHPLMLAVIIGACYTCWPKLNHARRYLAYGIMLLGLAALYLTVNAFVHQEHSLTNVGIIGCCVILAIFMLFALGLKEEMRRHELAKQIALEELNRLQQHQNTLLEKRVEERTEALRTANKRLQNQKQLLAQRNTKIELLINELNHRVKNNLQLLYSLLSLQLPIVKDSISRDILKGNIGKIRAMMLVNEKLFSFEKGRSIGLCEFISDMAVHLQKIYDTKEKTRILQDIPAGIRLSDKHTLSFGLILSELFTNTFKHAFRDHPDPCIRVKAVAVNDHLLEFIYADNGVGIPEDGPNEKFTMGIPLIKDLTRQMNGQMTVRGDKGLSYSFTIPV